MDLEFTVNNQTVKRKDSNKLVNCSSEYLQLSFTFETDDWTGLSKYAFFRTGHINYPFELDNEDKIVVPAYFLNDKYLLFGLFGVTDGDVRITTNVLRLHLEDSYYDAETVDVRNFLDVIVDDLNDKIDLKSDISYVDDELDKKSNTGHTHLKSDISDFSHNHDERYYTETETDGLLEGKVDKVTGKGLSSNDYTDSDRNIVSHIEEDLEHALDNLESAVLDKINARVKYIDVKDNLTSTDTDKPLSANQGKKLKTLVDTKANTSDMVIALNGKSDKGHKHTESDITDFKNYSQVGHTHTESDITDLRDYALVSDVPTKTSDLTNDVPFLTEHQSLADYYHKSEVDDLIHNIENKFILTGDKSIIQPNDNVDFYVKIKEEGFPVLDTVIHFFEMIEPVVDVSASSDILQTGDDVDWYAKVKDSDGSLASNVKVYFFEQVENIPTTLNVVADNTILSHADGDKGVLTATVLNQYDGAMGGQNVVFKVGSTVLDTVVTDDDGVAEYEYNSQGIGDVTFTVECTNLQETCTIQDLPFYADSMQKIKSNFIADTTSASGRTIYLSPFTFNSDVELEFKLKNIPNNWLVGFGSDGSNFNNKGLWFKVAGYNGEKASIMWADTNGSIRDAGITADYGTATVFTIKSENINKIYWYLNNTIQAYRDTQTTLPLGLRLDVFDNQDYDIEYIKVKPL